MYNDVMMLIAPTNRSKAYLQCMVKGNIVPSRVVIMAEDKQSLIEEKHVDQNGYGYFNDKIPLMHTILANNIQYEFVNTKDVNSECVREKIEQCREKYVIYSGYGGAILKKHFFEMDKKFIHVHAGALPEYRGSTTAYYSMLDKGIVSATAIFMNDKLDDGEVICSLDFDLPETDINIDYMFEPYVRAQVLVRALHDYNKYGKFITTQQNVEKAETYYVIHPVLKHIALLAR